MNAQPSPDDVEGLDAAGLGVGDSALDVGGDVGDSAHRAGLGVGASAHDVADDVPGQPGPDGRNRPHRSRVGRRLSMLTDGRPSPSPRRERLAIAGTWTLAVLVLVLLHWTGFAAIVLFVAYPALWMVHETRRSGILASIVFSTGIVLAQGTRPGGSWEDAVVNGLVYCTFSILMGLWFWHVYEISARLALTLEREREAREALRATQDELVAAEREAARTAEREQWARDVHDTLAQGFVSVITLSRAAGGELERGEQTAVAERLEQMEEVARGNLAEARALVAGEGPAGLRSGDLRAALGRLTDEQRRLGRAASLEILAFPEDLPHETQVVVLRVVQEALSNVSRHSGAERVTVRAAVDRSGTGRELVVTVEDEGVGTAGAPEGTGLTGMRARVEALSGTVTVDPAHRPDPDGSTGTVLEMRIPL